MVSASARGSAAAVLSNAEGPDAPAVLEIRDLFVAYPKNGSVVRAVDGVSLNLRRGEIVGLVGESGSGKTSIASSILGMLPSSAEARGDVVLGGEDLLGAPKGRLRQILGKHLALVPQNPMASLTPVLTIGYQLAEAVRAHSNCNRQEAREAAKVALQRVRVPDVDRMLRQYPHELSGGTKQRVLIAMALLHEPAVVVADEPTSALDATVQRQIVELLSDLVSTTRTSFLIISHDLALIAALANRICVMYSGHIVEEGDAATILTTPQHPYTRALMAAAEGQLDIATRHGTGSLPQQGCRFLARCPEAFDRCAADMPQLSSVSSGHAVRCFLTERTGR